MLRTAVSKAGYAVKRTVRQSGSRMAWMTVNPSLSLSMLRSGVAEKFTRPLFADSQRSGREHADTACWCSVELRGGCQKLCTGLADTYIRPGLHCRFDGFCMREQERVLWQVERPDPVAFEKCGTVRLAR